MPEWIQTDTQTGISYISSLKFDKIASKRVKIKGAKIKGSKLFTPPGEQCDCGSVEDCARSGLDACCYANNCTLRANAQCAHGKCCQSCTFKLQHEVCRGKADQGCDVEEFCTGESAHCPTVSLHLFSKILNRN